jgi:hypothetical protein
VARAKELANPQPTSAEDRLARLIGLFVVREIKEKQDQISLLLRAGFENTDVAEMLDVSLNYVSVAIYRNKAKERPARRKTSKK